MFFLLLCRTNTCDLDDFPTTILELLKESIREHHKNKKKKKDEEKVVISMSSELYTTPPQVINTSLPEKPYLKAEDPALRSE